MGRRAEGFLLVLALAAVAAFAASFVAGLVASGGDPPPPAAADPARQAPEAEASRIQVEVLNASGRAGLARRATDNLRAGGFDVIYYGNAGSDASPDSSVVLDRVGDLERARAVARRLGIEHVQSRPDTTLLLDVTVLLGRDWQPEG